MVSVTVVSHGQERRYDNVVAVSCERGYLRIDYDAPPLLHALWNGTRPLSTAAPQRQMAASWRCDGGISVDVREWED